VNKKLIYLFAFFAFFLGAAFTKAAGPVFYNPSNEEILLHVYFYEGPAFQGVIPAGEALALPNAWQVRGLEARLSSGEILILSKEEALKLRSGIEKPRSQVWVIDGFHVCVVESRKFKRERDFHCSNPMNRQ